MARMHFIYSTMNAGKSTALLQTNFGYLEKGMNTLLYTSEKDNRYGDSEIVSRIGLKSKAETFKDNDNLFDFVSKVCIIFLLLCSDLLKNLVYTR